MLCKLSLLAVVAPLVSALTVQIPENPTSGGTITIKWDSAPDDPATFSFELVNPAFNDAFAIANNVNPTAGQLTLTLPIVPVGGGYMLEAVNIGNISDVFSATSEFSIGATTTSLTSASSTSSGASSSSSQSGSISSGSATTPVTTPSSSTPGVTSNIVTSSQTTPASTSSGTPSTSAFSGAHTYRFNFGNSAGGIAAVVLSAVAGAAMIAF